MAQQHSESVSVPVSIGELIDKITILEIKSERISDPVKVENILYELSLLREVLKKLISVPAELEKLKHDLKEANEALWELEDTIRDCEREKDFGARFVETARSIYRSNDRRMSVKRAINDLVGSRIVEEKSYEKY